MTIPVLTMPQVLALWDLGLISDAAVEAWADREILRAETVPSDELGELSQHGPAACLRRSVLVFRERPLALGFRERFAAKLLATDLDSDEAVLAFATWAANAPAAEGYESPIARLCYVLDDLVHAGLLAEAAAGVRAMAPLLRADCETWAQRLRDTAHAPPPSLAATIAALESFVRTPAARAT